jgi:hypothetical protein
MDNAEIHRKTGLGDLLNPSMHFPGSTTKLVEQQQLRF